MVLVDIDVGVVGGPSESKPKADQGLKSWCLYVWKITQKTTKLLTDNSKHAYLDKFRPIYLRDTDLLP